MPASSVAVVPHEGAVLQLQHLDRQQRGVRGDAVQAGGAVVAGDDARHRGAVRRGQRPGRGVRGLPLIAFQPGARSCRYGWRLSTGPSSSATVTPLPSRARAASGRAAAPSDASCLATVAAG